MSKTIVKQLALMEILIGISTSGVAQTYDLVISNGRVIDPETKLDAVRNVTIKDGKITSITIDSISDKATIDAKNLIVSPGFIDIHSHSIVDLPGNRMQAHDGVTTALELPG